MGFYVARVECWIIYMRWNENDSLLISFELYFMNGNESLINEILSWLFIVTPLDWYPSWFSSRRHRSFIYGRCTGVWSYFAIGRWHGLHRPWLRCYYVGLANPNMVASCHMIKEEKENGEGIEKYIEMRNSWSWYLHSGMPPFILLCGYWLLVIYITCC